MKKVILLITLLSALLVLWIEFQLFPWIPCNCNATKINSIISNLSLATIAASIFYLIDVYLKELHESKKIRPHLNANYNKIISIASSLLNDIKNSSETNFSRFPPSTEELRNALVKIPLDSIYDTNRVVHLKWEDRIKEIARDSRDYLNRVAVFADKSKIETVLLLNELYSCEFFELANTIAPIKTIQQSISYINVNNMSMYSDSISEYFGLIEQLKKHIGNIR